jgi:hypothetical protein
MEMHLSKVMALDHLLGQLPLQHLALDPYLGKVMALEWELNMLPLTPYNSLHLCLL